MENPIEFLVMVAPGCDCQQSHFTAEFIERRRIAMIEIGSMLGRYHFLPRQSFRWLRLTAFDDSFAHLS